jgi:hypothetical protein
VGQDKYRITRGFTPNIHSLNISYEDEYYIEKWCFQDHGIAAPALAGMKSAIWFAKNESIYAERPLLVAKLEKQRVLNRLTHSWFVGALSVMSTTNSGFSSENRELMFKALDAAEHGPFQLDTAFDILRNFMPESHIKIAA